MAESRQTGPSGIAAQDSALARGLALYRAGDLDKSEAAGKAILAQAPRQPQALALLGLIRLERGDPAGAVRLFDESLEIAPDQTAVLNNRGNALKALGRLTDAIENYDKALAIRPDFPVACLNRGLALQALGRHEEALASYRRALQSKPDFADAFLNSGNAYQALGRYREAAASFDRAIALRPDDAAAHYNRGNLMQLMRRHEEALDCYARALALGAKNADLFNNNGLTLLALGRVDAALHSFESAVASSPKDARGYYNRGNALLELRRFEAAAASYEIAVELEPENADAHNNLANALLKLDRHEAALARYDVAIALAPDSARAHYNRGKALAALRRHGEALASCDKALALEPGHSGAAWDKSLLLLLCGDYAKGWPLYEARWKRDNFTSPKRDFEAPPWRSGEPLDGKTILLHAEQGFGDTIQFCRYAPLVARRGARVVLEVQPALKTLMASLYGVHEIVARGDALPGFDRHLPLLSLPLAFGTALETVPADMPYLHAQADAVGRWANRLGDRKRPRIGLAWSGSDVFKNDRNRSIALAALTPLLACDAAFIGLQREVRAADEAALAQASSLENFGPALVDFADTAALIANLDLVISVDTAVAHLAGALGKPVWVMLPYAPDWRWLLDRDDSPWYPTARLFRQDSFGNWAGVVQRVREALKQVQA